MYNLSDFLEAIERCDREPKSIRVSRIMSRLVSSVLSSEGSDVFRGAGPIPEGCQHWIPHRDQQIAVAVRVYYSSVQVPTSWQPLGFGRSNYDSAAPTSEGERSTALRKRQRQRMQFCGSFPDAPGPRIDFRESGKSSGSQHIKRARLGWKLQVC